MSFKLIGAPPRIGAYVALFSCNYPLKLCPTRLPRVFYHFGFPSDLHLGLPLSKRKRIIDTPEGWGIDKLPICTKNYYDPEVLNPGSLKCETLNLTTLRNSSSPVKRI